MSKITIKNNINSELSITHADNKSAKSIVGTDIAVAVDTINDLPLGASDGDTVIVRDLNRGGTFIYDSSKVAEHNDGTNFNGWIRQYDGAINIKWFGAKGDGITDDTDSVVRVLNALENGDTLDLGGANCSLFNSVGDVPADPNGEAVPLSGVPRLYNKSNITIKNGRLFAYDQKVGGAKYLFPTTLSIDSCENIILDNLILESKGENYGDTDASASLSKDARVAFAEQNGGHALLIVRSNNTKVINTKTIKCGSVGSFYVMSSNRTIATNCYSAPMSLGYAAFACDSWAGNSTEVGFDEFYTELNNCSTDANGGTYGSKNGVIVEDDSVTCRVNGGIYKDCYANGANHQLGAAFGASSAKIYVDGATVKDSASIGYSANTTNAISVVEISNTKGNGLRTSMHIQANRSFGTSEVVYNNCTADIVGGAVWSETELSVPTVIANMKRASHISVELNNCTVSGASTLSVNAVGCYGGITINGGEYTLKNRIFDSNGWGGASSNSNKGFIIKNGAYFEIINDTIDTSLLNSNVNSLCYIKNKDDYNVYTYLYIDFDINSKVVSRSSNFYSFSTISLQGSGLKEKEINDMELINCYDTMPTKERKNDFVVFISKTGTADSLSKVILKFPENRVTGTAFFDDSWAMRIIEGVVSAIDVSNNDVRQELYISDTSDNLTANKNYIIK